MERTEESPGLRWVKRPGGANEPYWRASEAARRAGYEIKHVRLVEFMDDLPAQCRRLQAQMLTWLAESHGDAKIRADYDQTIRSMLRIYQTNPDSSYFALKHRTRATYDYCAGVLTKGMGHRRIPGLTGLDLKRLHDGWRGPDNHVAVAGLLLSVLKAALRFGALCGLEGCQDLLTMAKNLRVPAPAPRTQAPTAADINLARAAAHALGHPRAALGYALQFEGTIRAWDVIGQWLPLSDPRPSAILSRGLKWIGPTWGQIDDMILTITPSKTERTTAKRVALDLSKMPMVMEELVGISDEMSGPLVINETTGLPYTLWQWQHLWQEVRREAGLPAELWNRDIRAGGVTEGGKAGATSDDRAKMAGHSKPKITAQVYDRDVVVAASRVSELRKVYRDRSK